MATGFDGKLVPEKTEFEHTLACCDIIHEEVPCDNRRGISTNSNLIEKVPRVEEKMAVAFNSLEKSSGEIGLVIPPKFPTHEDQMPKPDVTINLVRPKAFLTPEDETNRSKLSGFPPSPDLNRPLIYPGPKNAIFALQKAKKKGDSTNQNGGNIPVLADKAVAINENIARSGKGLTNNEVHEQKVSKEGEKRNYANICLHDLANKVISNEESGLPKQILSCEETHADTNENILVTDTDIDTCQEFITKILPADNRAYNGDHVETSEKYHEDVKSNSDPDQMQEGNSFQNMDEKIFDIHAQLSGFDRSTVVTQKHCDLEEHLKEPLDGTSSKIKTRNKPIYSFPVSKKKRFSLHNTYIMLIYAVLLMAINPILYVQNMEKTFVNPVNGNLSVYSVVKGRKKTRIKKVSKATGKQLPGSLENGNHVSEGDGVIEECCHTIHEPGHVELMQPPSRKGSQNRQYKFQPQDVECDGKISDIASDPPGQQSIYIPPGDPRKEAYRLSTFENFPTSPAEPSLLARHGFFYTGFYDRVKCFSCARTVQEWRRTDDARDRKWHNPNCAFAKGLQTDNVPIAGSFAAFLSNNPNSLGSSSSQPMDVTERQQLQQPTTLNTVRYPGNLQGAASSSSGGTYQFGPGTSLNIGGQTATAVNPIPPSSQYPANPAPQQREWRMANVISSDHRRMLTNLFLVRELDRLASFCRWSMARPNVSPVALAKAGFFYLGDMDRTQCFSCGGVLRNWTVEDDAFQEHRSHFPDCRFILGLDERNVPIPEQEETDEVKNEKYPCRFPSNPHMRAGRVDTFDRRWPRGRVEATPEQIAEAGFFFLGERDRVKCWYCNGGLQNWEYDDVPWVEHAKWFPTCQFLLKAKGIQFVYRHLRTAPHFPRPVIARQDGGRIGPRAVDIPPPIGSRVQAPSPPPEIVDPQEEMRKRKEKVDRIMENSDNVQTVIAMGYEADTVRIVLEEAAETSQHEEIFDGMMSLLEEVMKKEEEIKKQRELDEIARVNRERQQTQAPMMSFQTVSSNYSMPSNVTSMETTPSVPEGGGTGVFEVSGFGDSDDENQDLYGGIMDGETVPGAAGGSTSTSGPANPTTVGNIVIPQDDESIKEILEQKQDEKICKICYVNQADMVFLPCSHMICCKTCTEAIRHCPICRKKIEKAIKTYMR